MAYRNSALYKQFSRNLKDDKGVLTRLPDIFVDDNASGNKASGSKKPYDIPGNIFQQAQKWYNANPNIWDPYGGQMTAGLSPFQQMARTNLSGFLAGNPSGYTQLGAEGLSGLLGFNPSMVNAQNTNVTSAGYAGDVTPQNVTAGSFPGSDISQYMNPYNQQVVDTALSDIDRARQLANQQGARSAGASTYGGDRNALIEAETNRAALEQAGRTSAQLRSQGFDTAAGLQQSDLNRQFQASLANQGLGLQAGLANQGTLQGLNQFNAGQANQYGLANAQLGMQAALANQNAGLQGANIQLGAGMGLGSLGDTLFNQGLSGASALNQFGTQDQATQQGGLDRQYQEYLRSTYGPMQGFNWLSGLTNNFPYYQTPGSNQGAGFLGGALSGASVGSAFGPWGAGIGGLLGGLGGLF